MIIVTKEENIDSIYAALHNNDLVKKTFNSMEKVKKYSKKIYEKGFLFSAYKEETIVGFICGYANDFINKKAYISFLCIDSNNGMQNAIVINKLFKASEDYIRKKGMTSIIAEVHDDNLHAINIYKSMGFIDKEKTDKKTHYIELKLGEKNER